LLLAEGREEAVGAGVAVPLVWAVPVGTVVLVAVRVAALTEGVGAGGEGVGVREAEGEVEREGEEVRVALGEAVAQLELGEAE
jgi:hypothetical protein